MLAMNCVLCVRQTGPVDGVCLVWEASGQHPCPVSPHPFTSESGAILLPRAPHATRIPQTFVSDMSPCKEAEPAHIAHGVGSGGILVSGSQIRNWILREAWGLEQDHTVGTSHYRKLFWDTSLVPPPQHLMGINASKRIKA